MDNCIPFIPTNYKKSLYTRSDGIFSSMAPVLSSPLQETYFKHAAYRPQDIIQGAISVDENVKLSFANIERIGNPSTHPSSPSPASVINSIGQLNDLPLELLHETLRNLDLQSLSRLSRASLGTKLVTESLPEYRELLSAAGHIFHILTRTKTIHLHSVATLHATLVSDRCKFCLDCYGPFLFLLSAERCCYPCLLFDPSLRMIPLLMARDCFNLSFGSLKKLPVLRSIPGEYYVEWKVSRKRAIKLTSVRAAKQFALRLHGSAAAMAAHLKPLEGAVLYQDPPFYDVHSAARKNSIYYNWLLTAPLKRRPAICNLWPSAGTDVPSDDYCGMGSVAFPTLMPTGSEHGIWCRGCNLRKFTERRDWLDSGCPRLDLTSCKLWRNQPIKSVRYRARSHSEFLEHLNHCDFAKALLEREGVTSA